MTTNSVRIIARTDENEGWKNSYTKALKVEQFLLLLFSEFSCGKRIHFYK